MSKAIVVLIGNNGTIISKHNGKNVTSEFVDKISDDNKPNLSSFFNKNKGFNMKKYLLIVNFYIQIFFLSNHFSSLATESYKTPYDFYRARQNKIKIKINTLMFYYILISIINF